MPPPGQTPHRIVAAPPPARKQTPPKTPFAPKRTAAKTLGKYEDVLRPGGRSEVPVDQQLEHVKRNYFDPQNPAKPEQQKVVVQRLQTWATKNPSNAKAAAFARTPAIDRPRGAVPEPEKPNRDTKVIQLANTGIPIAQAAPDLLRLLDKLDPGERTNVIAGFPDEGHTIKGLERASLERKARENGNTLPPNATDKQLLLAANRKAEHKTVLGGAVNFLKGAALAPAGAFAGGYAVGQAANAAITRQDFAPAKEIAAQQLDFVKGAVDPDKLYQDPFGYTLGAYAVARGGAGLAGGAARAGALGAGAKAFADRAGTERLVLPPARESIKTAEGLTPETPRINVGTYAKNPIDLAAQRLADKARERSSILANQAVGKTTRKQIGLSDTLSKKAEADLVRPVYRKLASLKRDQQRAVIFSHYARGSKPSEMVSFYQRAVDENPTPDNTGALAVWQRIHERVGDELTPKMQQTLAAMREAGVKADDVAREIKDPMGKRTFSDEGLERGRGIEAAIVRAQHGDEHAQAVLDAEARATNLASDLKAARKPIDQTVLRMKTRAADRDSRRAMQNFLATRGDDQPGYVVSKSIDPDAPTRGITTAGRASISGDPKPKLGGATKRNEGVLLRTGKANVSPEAYLGGLARNTKVRNVLDSLERVLAQNAVREANGMSYDANVWVARRLDVPDHQGGKLERQGHSITEKARALDEMQPKEQGAQLAQGWVENLPKDGRGHSVVPDEGEWILVRQTARHEFDGRMRIQDAKLQSALNATRGWRWLTLNARPAWLVANLVGNPVMAGLGGTGPVSIARAMSGKYADVIPGQIKNAGPFARAIGPDANTTNRRGIGVVERTLGRAEPMSLGITRAARQGTKRTLEELRTENNYHRVGTLATTPFRIVRFAGNLAAETNIRWENMLRDATYLSKAVPESRRKIHGEIGSLWRKTSGDVMADLKNTRTMEEAAPRLAEHVADFLGQLSSHTRGGDTLTIVAPFWRWIAFISKQTLVTLPAKHPARALLLHQLGNLGLTATGQMGMLNPAYQGGIPMGTDEAGRARIQPTGAFNVWATPSQITGGPLGNFSGLVGATNPLAGIAFEALTGRDAEGNVAENKYGEAIVPQNDPTIPYTPDSLGDRLDLLKNRLATVVPFGSLIDPSFGEADTGEQRTTGKPSVYSEPGPLERTIGYVSGYRPRGIDLAENEARKRRSLKRSLKAEKGRRKKHGSSSGAPLPGETVWK